MTVEAREVGVGAGEGPECGSDDGLPAGDAITAAARATDEDSEPLAPASGEEDAPPELNTMAAWREAPATPEETAPAAPEAAAAAAAAEGAGLPGPPREATGEASGEADTVRRKSASGRTNETTGSALGRTRNGCVFRSNDHEIPDANACSTVYPWCSNSARLQQLRTNSASTPGMSASNSGWRNETTEKGPSVSASTSDCQVAGMTSQQLSSTNTDAPAGRCALRWKARDSGVTNVCTSCTAE